MIFRLLWIKVFNQHIQVISLLSLSDLDFGMSLENVMYSRICIVNRGLEVSPWLAKCLPWWCFMVSGVWEMILKNIKFSIFGLTHILHIADIALQAIYEIIAFAIPIHHSIEGMCCTMSGYIAIMADSCTVLRSLGPMILGLWPLFALGDLSPNRNVWCIWASWMWPLWTCIHVLILVHILTKVWDKMKGECNIQTGQHRGTHVCMQLCKEDGADIES